MLAYRDFPRKETGTKTRKSGRKTDIFLDEIRRFHRIFKQRLGGEKIGPFEISQKKQVWIENA